MGNVNLPTPLALAGGALCALGGYLLGIVVDPDTASRTIATVRSFDPGSSELCLTGEGLEEQAGEIENGVLCGTWRRTQGSATPAPRDLFRFVSVAAGTVRDAEGRSPATVIYGEVVG